MPNGRATREQTVTDRSTISRRTLVKTGLGAIAAPAVHRTGSEIRKETVEDRFLLGSVAFVHAFDAFRRPGRLRDQRRSRQRRTDEVFPWEHITAAVRKNFLFQDFRQSLEGQIRVDCRLNCFACGILPTFAEMRRHNPGEVWQCPEVRSKKVPVSDLQIPLTVLDG